MTKKYNLAIVAAEFNYDITSMMIERARAQAEFLEVNIAETVMVPGVFDMPLAIKKMLKRKDIDGVVTLGAVIEGSTEHDEVVIAHAARKIADLSLEFEKPVSLGITGPGMTQLEAVERIETGRDAVDVVVKMLKRLA